MYGGLVSRIPLISQKFTGEVTDETPGIRWIDGGCGSCALVRAGRNSRRSRRRRRTENPESRKGDATWATAGNRVHGIGWEGDTLWAADSNLRAFFRHDIKTGKMIERIQLTETDPIIHGATVRDGYMWFCDDVGWIANFKM